MVQANLQTSQIYGKVGKLCLEKRMFLLIYVDYVKRRCKE